MKGAALSGLATPPERTNREQRSKTFGDRGSVNIARIEKDAAPTFFLVCGGAVCNS